MKDNSFVFDSVTLPRRFIYMSCLQQAFNEPAGLLRADNIPHRRKQFLLKRWRDERTLYLAENCRDMDYLQDKEMQSLLKAVERVKETAGVLV